MGRAECVWPAVMAGHSIFSNIEEQVANLELSEGVFPPHVLCTPVPAFPGIWLASLIGPIVAEEIHQPRIRTVRRMDNLGLAMTITLNKDGR